jgi:hypothetical protein
MLRPAFVSRCGCGFSHLFVWSEFMAQGFGTEPAGSMNALAKAKVNGPSIGLIIVGALGIVIGLYNLAQGAMGGAVAPPAELQQDAEAMKFFEMIRGVGGTAAIVLGLIQAAIGGLTIFGAIKMKNLESYGLAMTCSILNLLPCLSGCCFVGLPIGIWSLVVLMKPEVKSAFH